MNGMEDEGMAIYTINGGSTGQRKVEADHWEFKDDFIVFYDADAVDKAAVFAVKKQLVNTIKRD